MVHSSIYTQEYRLSIAAGRNRNNYSYSCQERTTTVEQLYTGQDDIATPVTSLPIALCTHGDPVDLAATGTAGGGCGGDARNTDPGCATNATIAAGAHKAIRERSGGAILAAVTAIEKGEIDKREREARATSLARTIYSSTAVLLKALSLYC